MRRRYEPLLTAVFLTGVAVTAYLPVLRAGFVFDDRAQILRNPSLLEWSTAIRAFGQSVWQFFAGAPAGLYYRPLFNALLVVQFHLFGLRPEGWHAVSLGLHVLVCVLVQRLGAAWGLTPPAALAAALLFAVHPVHVESVAWVSASPDLLAAVFLALAAIAWERSRVGASARDLALSTLCFVVASASKENALAFPVFVVARELCAPPAQRVPRRRLLACLTAFAGVWCVVLGARLLVLRTLASVDSRSARFSSGQELMTVPSALITYARLLIAPWELKIRYAVTFVEQPSAREFFLPLLAVVAGVAMLVWWSRRLPVAAVGFAWTLCFLLPVLHLRGFNPLESLVHDRYLYVPSIGFAVSIAAVVFPHSQPNEFLARRPWAAIRVAGLIALVIAGAVLTFRQTRVWQDEERFVPWALAADPQSPFFENYAGAFHALRGEWGAAEEHYCRALELLPSYDDALTNVRDVLMRQGRVDEARETERRLRGERARPEAGLCAHSAVGRAPVT